MPTGLMGGVQSLDISVTPPVPQPALNHDQALAAGPPPGMPVASNSQSYMVDQAGFEEAPPIGGGLQGGFAAVQLVLGGTLHNGDIIHSIINGHDVQYTVVSGDTTFAILAGHVAAAINADSTVSPIVTATSGVAFHGGAPPAGGLVISADNPGPVGMYSFSANVTGAGATVTATPSGDELTFGPPTTN